MTVTQLASGASASSVSVTTTASSNSLLVVGFLVLGASGTPVSSSGITYNSKPMYTIGLARSAPSYVMGTTFAVLPITEVGTYTVDFGGTGGYFVLQVTDCDFTNIIDGFQITTATDTATVQEANIATTVANTLAISASIQGTTAAASMAVQGTWTKLGDRVYTDFTGTTDAVWGWQYKLLTSPTTTTDAGMTPNVVDSANDWGVITVGLRGGNGNSAPAFTGTLT